MEIENIGMDIEEDILFLTIGKYKMFMSEGATGRDAQSLYLHLMFTAKLQKTNQIKATDTYLKKGLSMGADKLRKAKNLLKKMGLIKTVVRRDNGKITGHYIKVHARTMPQEIEGEKKEPEHPKPTSGNSPEWETRDKCFNEKVKCLNEKDKIYNSFLEKIYKFWLSRDGTIKHRDIKQVKEKVSRKKLEQILKYYKPKEIARAIENYTEVVNNPKYYYNHKWSLWDFLKRGYEKFLDESEPHVNFVKNTPQLKKSTDKLPELEEF